MIVILIGVAVIAAVVWYLRRPAKTVRRMSRENPDDILKRTPVNPVCPCGKPRCPYKGREHPRGPNKARDMSAEDVISTALRRSRRRWKNG
jgi:hypothetical protein